MENKPQLSAIWICPRDDPRQQATLDAYLQALGNLTFHTELTIVGNGTLSVSADELHDQLRQNSIPVRMLVLHRRCDDSTAIRIGLEGSSGKYVALLPQYLQTDPAEISRMLERVEDGADYVASWRFPRVDSKWNVLKSNVFNTLTRLLTRVPIHDVNSGLRIMRREVADSVPMYGDLDRFLPIMAVTHGYRVDEVKTRHLEERVQKGDYRFGVYVRRILDLVTLFFLYKFTQKPLRFFGLLGISAIGFGALTTAIVSAQRLLGTPLADRPALVYGVLLIVLGVQLFSLGLLGELVIFTQGDIFKCHYVKRIYESDRNSEHHTTEYVNQ